MKLASTTGDFRGYAKTTADAVRFYEGTGFRHLDYNFYNVIYPESPFLGDRWLDEVEEAGREAERLGFDFIQAHSPNYNPFDPKADHEAGMLATIRSIEACGRLGIPNIVVHPGMTTELTYPDGRDGYFSRNRDFYRSLFPAMEKWNVNVLIENSAEANMGTRYFFMTGQEMRDFADYVDHPLLHCNWDIGHANMRGTDQREDILAMGGHLRGLHIQDNFGACDEHIAPFMGTTDMDAVMQGLLEVGYKGYFTFETENMLLSYGRWPHRRRQAPSVTGRRLAAPSLDLRRKAAAFLYEIGRSILSAYDCYEE
ncbi:MAG: sugar phosphate isomerase/epimerase [Kiritimatiellae bacterium]|nr:sugar phosphate isomerase/epimerase [Kiritimatiellia bacterium]